MTAKQKLIKVYPDAKRLFEMGYDYNEVEEMFDRQDGLNRLEIKRINSGDYSKKKLVGQIFEQKAE